MRLVPAAHGFGREDYLDSSRHRLSQIVFQGKDVAGVAFERLRQEISVIAG
jgi:hypothetical protein